jgi:hypothetical protein
VYVNGHSSFRTQKCDDGRNQKIPKYKDVTVKNRAHVEWKKSVNGTISKSFRKSSNNIKVQNVENIQINIIIYL